MIEMPRRSVTRFFIPLIDVMILLFCIFLLMPIFKETPEYKEKQALRGQTANEEEELKNLQAEVKRLKQWKGLPVEQRLAIRVLEIDPANGALLEPGRASPRRVIDSAIAAQALIERHQKELATQYPHPAGRPELHYLFMLPRVNSAYPEGQQLDRYLDWFAKVSHGIDRPSRSK